MYASPNFHQPAKSLTLLQQVLSLYHCQGATYPWFCQQYVQSFVLHTFFINMPIDVKALVDVNKTRKGRDFKDKEES
jgi:hypothetical protein